MDLVDEQRLGLDLNQGFRFYNYLIRLFPAFNYTFKFIDFIFINGGLDLDLIDKQRLGLDFINMDGIGSEINLLRLMESFDVVVNSVSDLLCHYVILEEILVLNCVNSSESLHVDIVDSHLEVAESYTKWLEFLRKDTIVLSLVDFLE